MGRNSQEKYVMALYPLLLFSLSLSHSQLCGVSILRAGEVLEPALMSVCKDVMIGKILIQTNEQTENPEVREYACLLAHL